MKITTLIAFVSVLVSQFSITVVAELTYGNKGCTDTGLNYTTSSEYEHNLGQVLGNLSSKSSSVKFYNYTVGNAPNQVYGLYQCRNDISLDVCNQCIKDAAYMITGVCPLYGEAIVWYYECMLRYANRSIFSLSETTPTAYLLTSDRVTNYAQFAPILANEMTGVIENASFASPHFASGETNFTLSQKLYTFAQCTPDIDLFDCKSCLIKAYTDMIQCCDASIEAKVFTPSCQLRYDTTGPFLFDNQSSPSPSSSLSPPSPPTPPPPPSLAVHDETREKKTTMKSGIVGAIAACVLVGLAVLTIVCWMCLCHKKRKSQERLLDDSVRSDAESLRVTNFKEYRFTELKTATEGFSNVNKLGEGGFAIVYKGILCDGEEIAIKRLLKKSGQDNTDFMVEARLRGKLQHKNLIKLMGFCLENGEKLLVYELMPNGSLGSFFTDPVKRPSLDWRTRQKIIMGIARGLQYLHEDCPSTIIHRDLKPDNILLDKNLNPKIADFGLAKLCDDVDLKSMVTELLKGTRGYMPPEYLQRGKYSNKFDVFGFGVMLLEIVRGQSNFHFSETSQMGDLPTHAWRLWKAKQLSNLIDSALINKTTYQNSENEMVRCVHIGLLCLQENAEERPDMPLVISYLTSSGVLPLPSTPTMFSPVPPMKSQSALLNDTDQSSSINSSTPNSDPTPR